MDVNICKFDRESICATCLSQDRKLFTVSDLHASAKFYSELSLSWTDKVCWECHHAVRKMVAFKDKALKAQAWLWSTTDSQHCRIQCLSSLGISKGIFLNVTDTGLHSFNSEPEPTVFVTVKQELIEDNTFHENMSSVEKAEVSVESVDNHSDVRVKEEEIQNFVISVPSIKERKRNLPTPEPKPPAPETKQTDLCTEETLTEEGLIKWRKKKRKINFFAQCIPIERCDKCIQPFENPLSARIHARKHTDLYGDVECNICEQRLVEEGELEFHKKLHYRVLKCSQCVFEWDDMNTMRQHWSDVHGVKQTVWDCEPCKRRFSNSKKLASHLSSHRRKKCAECGKAFTEQHLKKHMIQHRGGRPLHSCGECGGKFRGEEGLKAHMRTHSTEIDPAAFCTECNIQFRNMNLYHNHLRYTNIHASESDFKYKCEVCGMRYRKSYNYQNHVKVHHTDFVYPCDQCDQTFKTKAGRRLHKERKHEGKVLPRDKLCDHCGRGFTSKGLLLSHINTHTGARPFVCKLCGADFGHKSALYLHGRYKHKIQKKKKTQDKKMNSENDNNEKDNSGKDPCEKVPSEKSDNEKETS